MGSRSGQIQAAHLSPRLPHRGQIQCNEPGPRKKASPLFNCRCYYVILLWAYIIVRNNSSNGTDRKYIFLKLLLFFFLPSFRRPLWMTAPVAFAYTAYALGRLCPSMQTLLPFITIHLTSSFVGLSIIATTRGRCLTVNMVNNKLLHSPCTVVFQMKMACIIQRPFSFILSIICVNVLISVSLIVCDHLI